ncbi:xanthine dehydrogenase family protein subunit M [Rhodobacteraceae bacterium Araon29]
MAFSAPAFKRLKRRLPLMSIDISRPKDLSTASQILAQDRNAYILGGGTGLMRRIHEGDQNVRHLIRVQDLELGKITRLGTAFRIGSQVTMTQLLAEPALQFLHAAAASVGAPALRNMATIGGNLFSRPPYGDLTTALLALEAHVVFMNGNRQDQQALEEFLKRSGPRKLVFALEIPTTTNKKFFYHKMTRSHPRGASLITLASSFQYSAGRHSMARIAFGGLGGRPFRALNVERALTGGLTAASIDAACVSLKNGTEPFSDALASGWYRMEMAQLHLRRILTDLL